MQKKRTKRLKDLCKILNKDLIIKVVFLKLINDCKGMKYINLFHEIEN